MNEGKGFEERRGSRPVKRSLSLGAVLLFGAGLLAGAVFGQAAVGVVLFALGAVLFAARGYLNNGDKVAAGVLIFVAVAAMGIQTIVYFLGS